jgi:3-oxoacyl-[acyl-carrier protein] reductase
MQELLTDRVAIVYGAGPIGSSVALAFAAEGARVFVANRSESAGHALVAKIAAQGGSAESAKVDALDKESIEAFVDGVVETTGRLDISFNAVNVDRGGGQGTMMADLDYEEFALPIATYTKTQFLTANAATPHMVKQGSGVIMMITAIPSRMPVPGSVGFGVAWAAMEALCRTLAVELGPRGVRTICLHSTGSPETADSIARTFNEDPAVMKKFMEGWTERSAQHQLLPQPTSLANVGAMAAFMASDNAGASTGSLANMSAGMNV